MTSPYPASDDPRDDAAAERQHAFVNAWFLDPLLKGATRSPTSTRRRRSPAWTSGRATWSRCAPPSTSSASTSTSGRSSRTSRRTPGSGCAGSRARRARTRSAGRSGRPRSTGSCAAWTATTATRPLHHRERLLVRHRARAPTGACTTQPRRLQRLHRPGRPGDRRRLRRPRLLRVDAARQLRVGCGLQPALRHHVGRLRRRRPPDREGQRLLVARPHRRRPARVRRRVGLIGSSSDFATNPVRPWEPRSARRTGAAGGPCSKRWCPRTMLAPRRSHRHDTQGQAMASEFLGRILHVNLTTGMVEVEIPARVLLPDVPRRLRDGAVLHPQGDAAGDRRAGPGQRHDLDGQPPDRNPHRGPEPDHDQRPLPVDGRRRRQPGRWLPPRGAALRRVHRDRHPWPRQPSLSTCGSTTARPSCGPPVTCGAGRRRRPSTRSGPSWETRGSRSPPSARLARSSSASPRSSTWATAPTAAPAWAR